MIASYSDGSCRFLNWSGTESSSSEAIRLAPTEGQPDYVFLGPLGERIAYAGRNGHLKFVNVRSKEGFPDAQLEAFLPRATPGRLRGAAFSPGGNLFLASYRDLMLKIYRLRSGPTGSTWKEINRFTTWASFNFIAISRDGKYLAMASRAGPTTTIWTADVDAGSWKEHGRVGSSGDVRSVVISNDSRYLACCTREGMVSIWSLSGGERVFGFKAHNGEINSLAFGSKDDRLVTGASNGEIKIWNLAVINGEPAALLVGQLRGHGASVNAIRFTPDGKTLITAGGQGANFAELGIWSTLDPAMKRANRRYQSVEELLSRRSGLVLFQIKELRTELKWSFSEFLGR